MYSQTYLDSSSVWSEWYSGFDGINNHYINYKYFFTGDTVITGKTYYKIWQTGIDTVKDFPRTNIISIDTIDRYYGAIREALGKFYAKFSSPEYVLYDFNLSVGSVFQSQTCGNIIVTEIDTVYFGSQMRKRFRFDTWYTYTEGIGGWSGLFGNLCMFFESDSRLICYKKGNDIFIGDTTSYGCDLTTSTGIIERQNGNLLIFPNHV
ncbi:MAG: hypothetical protein IIA88_04820, partial [Bacteroidetes bacterium]|nr:hypothetical protein [Bacteroidota bacterium]